MTVHDILLAICCRLYLVWLAIHPFPADFPFRQSLTGIEASGKSLEPRHQHKHDLVGLWCTADPTPALTHQKPKVAYPSPADQGPQWPEPSIQRLELISN